MSVAIRRALENSRAVEESRPRVELTRLLIKDSGFGL